MKIRSSFVSNSSSCSFIIYKHGLSSIQIKYLENMDRFLLGQVGIEQDKDGNLPLTFIPRMSEEDIKGELEDWKKYVKRGDYQLDDNDKERIARYNEAIKGKTLIFSTAECLSYPQLFLSLLGIPDNNVKEFVYIGSGSPANGDKEWIETLEKEYKEFLESLIAYAVNHLDSNGKFHPDSKGERIHPEVAKKLLLYRKYSVFGD